MAVAAVEPAASGGLLSIFFFLLARDAESRVGQRVETIVVDVLAAILALPERLG